MAISRGAGTEIIRSASFEQVESTAQTLIQGVQHHIYTVLSIIFFNTGGTDNGGIPFINRWDVQIPYDGWYKLRAKIDDIGTISIDGDVKLDLNNRNVKQA